MNKLFSVDTTLRIVSTIAEPVNSVRNLRVYIDSALSMRTHIGKVSAACFYQLCHLRQLRYVVSKSTMQRLVSSLVLARIDYCNSVLAGLPAVTLAPLNRVMNAAARLVVGLGVRDHVMRELHYITNVLVPMSSLQRRVTLRSSTSDSFDVPRTRTVFSERAFSVAGHAAWNKLPPNLSLITDNYRFKRALKAHFSVQLIAVNLGLFHVKRRRTIFWVCVGGALNHILLLLLLFMSR